jgi:hypothetical protein
MASFSASEVGQIKFFINGRPVNDRLRYQKQAMEYLLMTHYNMTLKDVREMNINDAKQLLYWAQAMQGEEQAAEGAVYLGYDLVAMTEEGIW